MVAEEDFVKFCNLNPITFSQKKEFFSRGFIQLSGAGADLGSVVPELKEIFLPPQHWLGG
jgi:hypothetical protein